jgi:t-SNARE complex subunit (syntaxin)|tara:strand:+ start:69 stop:236 length:168 start_codon:yes stop_codon:yes gene_type:complete
MIDSIDRYDARVQSAEIEEIKEKVVRIEELMEEFVNVLELMEERLVNLANEVRRS